MAPRWITGVAIVLFAAVFASLELGAVRTPSFGRWDLAILGASLIILVLILYTTRGRLVAVLFAAGLLLSQVAGPLTIWMAQSGSPKTLTVIIGLAVDLAGLALLVASAILATRFGRGTAQRITDRNERREAHSGRTK